MEVSLKNQIDSLNLFELKQYSKYFTVAYLRILTEANSLDLVQQAK